MGFGKTPEVLGDIDCDKMEALAESGSIPLANVSDTTEYEQQHKDEVPPDTKPSENNSSITKMEVEVSKSVKTTTFKFSSEYFVSVLEKVGAFLPGQPLMSIKNVSIGHVVATKSVGLFKDQDIIKWIKKGCKISPQLTQKYRKMGKEMSALFVEQFKKYKKLSLYLLNEAEQQDINTWLDLLEKPFVWPEDIDSDWKLVFGEVPELCQKIDNESKLDLVMRTENTTKFNEKSNEKDAVGTIPSEASMNKKTYPKTRSLDSS